MHVAKLEVSGVRGFHPPRTVNLDFTRPGEPDADPEYAGWTVLAGRNGSGKSTLLQCIALALAGPRNTGQLRVTGDDWDIDWLSDERRASELIRLTLNPNLEDAGTVEPLEIFVAWDTWGDRSGSTLGWGIDGSQAISWLPERLASEPGGSWTVKADRWFFAGYGPFRRLSGAQIGTGRGGEGNRAAALRTLFDEDASLTEGVSWLIEQHLFRLEGRPGAQELLDTVLTLLGDVLLPDGFRIFKVAPL